MPAVVVLAAVLVTAVTVLRAAPASAQGSPVEAITRYDTDVTIRPDGRLVVVETITYDFGPHRRHGIIRVIPERVDYPPRRNHDRVYPIRVRSVRASGGASAQHQLSRADGDLTIRVGDPDRTVTGVFTYELTYEVRGALNGFEDHDELVWNAIGTEWTVPIAEATTTVHAPAEVLAVNCASGAFGSALPCDTAASTGRDASFSTRSLPVFAGMTVTVAIPRGVVPRPRPILEERFSLSKAFATTTVNVVASVAMLVAAIVGFVFLGWRLGRDRRFRGSPVDVAFASATGAEERVPLFADGETPVEFVPPDGLRPGQMGTLVDFEANPLDVTATIVDLAVRGYLTIEELESRTWFRRGDWRLTKTKEPDDLLAYERALHDGLFRSRTSVDVSDLRNTFASTTQKVRKELIDDAVERGWFSGRPATVRALWTVVGALVVALGIGGTIVLAAETHAGLLGLPVIVAGVLVVVAARWMPRRTAKGYAAWRRAEGFRRFIDESEKERARFAERASLFSEYLPFAVVFGATERWARAFEGIDGVEAAASGWYSGRGPFTYLALSHAIDGFSVTTAGTLTSTPASSGGSGFSGGGFSGGGGGGGGGGSW